MNVLISRARGRVNNWLLGSALCGLYAQRLPYTSSNYYYLMKCTNITFHRLFMYDTSFMSSWFQCTRNAENVASTNIVQMELMCHVADGHWWSVPLLPTDNPKWYFHVIPIDHHRLFAPNTMSVIIGGPFTWCDQRPLAQAHENIVCVYLLHSTLIERDHN